MTDALALAQSLNLTVMRSWAFTDGSDQYAPIQPERGMLDQKALTEGLDYFVSQAEQYGIKLILTLTNYFVRPPFFLRLTSLWTSPWWCYHGAMTAPGLSGQPSWLMCGPCRLTMEALSSMWNGTTTAMLAQSLSFTRTQHTG